MVSNIKWRILKDNLTVSTVSVPLKEAEKWGRRAWDQREEEGGSRTLTDHVL